MQILYDNWTNAKSGLSRLRPIIRSRFNAFIPATTPKGTIYIRIRVSASSQLRLSTVESARSCKTCSRYDEFVLCAVLISHTHTHRTGAPAVTLSSRKYFR